MNPAKPPVLPQTWGVRWECRRRWLASWALLWFGRIFLGLGAARPAGAAGHPPPARILVVRIDRIGDNVLNSAFLREFRARFPRARITLLVRPATYNLVELCPYVDEVLSFGLLNRWHWRRLPKLPQLLGYAAWVLWPRRFDLAVNPRWEGDYNRATPLMFLSRAARRVAFSEKISLSRMRRNCGYDLLLTEPVAERVRGQDLQRSLAMVRHLGGSIRSEAAEVWVDQRDRDRAAELLGESNGTPEDRLLSVAIGASGQRRIWPRERFIALLRHYDSLPGYRIVILGGEAERPAAAAIAGALGPNAINLAGRATLRETAAVLERTRLFIGNDSGALHLAAATGCPVVVLRREGLAGARFFPWQVPYRDLQAQAPASGHDASDPWPGVSAEAVRDAVDALLAETEEMSRGRLNRGAQVPPAAA